MVHEEEIFELIVGTYEEFVLGYTFSEKEKHGQTLEQTFANHSHRASVKSVAATDKLVASAGTDETIHLYNMVERRESGILTHHTGTVTFLCFTPDGSHLVSTSEDGSIAFYRVGSWILEKVFKTAHKGLGVECIAIHPTGKLALSVGKDHTLRTWNLVKGRRAYATNLASRCKSLEYVLWSPGGNRYAIPMGVKLEILDVATAGVTHILDFKDKESTICVGESSGRLSGHCLDTAVATELWSLGEGTRVKAIATTSEGVRGSEWLVTACSDGRIAVYRLAGPQRAPTQVTSAETGCRLTCLAIRPNVLTNKKVKQEIKTAVKPVVVHCCPRSQQWDVQIVQSN